MKVLRLFINAVTKVGIEDQTDGRDLLGHLGGAFPRENAVIPAANDQRGGCDPMQVLMAVMGFIFLRLQSADKSPFLPEISIPLYCSH